MVVEPFSDASDLGIQQPVYGIKLQSNLVCLHGLIRQLIPSERKSVCQPFPAL